MSSRVVCCTLCAAAICVAGAGNNLAVAQSAIDPVQLALAPNAALPGDLDADVVNAVPDDALYVALAGNVLETKGTVEKLLARLKVPVNKTGQQKFTDALARLQGWNPKALHALAFVPGADGDVEPVVFVPVNNFKSFAKSIGADPDAVGPTTFAIEDGPSGLVAERPGFAVLVQKGKQPLLERVVASKKSIAATIAPSRSWIAKQQVSLVALPTGVKKKLNDGIRVLEKFKENFPAGVPQAESIGAVFDTYAELLRKIRDEVKMATFGARYDDSAGLDLAALATFQPDSRFAAASKGAAALPPAPLSGLPDGDFFVAGAGVLHESWTQALLDVSLGLSTKLPKEAGGFNLSPEQVKELSEATRDSMQGVKRMSVSMSLSGKTLFSGMYSRFQTADAAKFIDGYEKAIARMAEIAKKNPASTYPQQQAARRKIDGRDVLVLTTDLTKMLEQMGANQPPQVKGMLETMLGTGGKVLAYVTAIDAETVVMAYDEDALKSVIATAKEGQTGLAGNARIKTTSAMLPADSHVLGFLSVGGYIQLIQKVVSGAAGDNGVPLPFQIPPFPDSPPLGFSARVSPAALEAHVVAPIGLMEGVRDYVQQVTAMFRGAN